MINVFMLNAVIPILLVQLVESLAASRHVHSCVQAIRPGSIPGADNLYSGFQTYRVGEMSSSQ